jgi:hypothetical protein
VSRRGPQGGGVVGTTGSGNVFAGRDGNVYRKQGDSWQQYGGGGGWSGAQPSQLPAATARGGDAVTTSQLNRDAAARSAGAQRTRDAASMRSGSSSMARSGSYRPSGGGMRGGGMRGGGRRR